VSPELTLAALRGAGVIVTTQSGQLRLQGSAAILGTDLANQARQHREAILALLLAENKDRSQSGEIDCNTATPIPIISQLPEENGDAGTVAVPIVEPLQIPKVQHPTANDRFQPEAAGGAPEDHCSLENRNTSATTTATPITSQVPEENRWENGDRCSVAVDFGGLTSLYSKPSNSMDSRYVEGTVAGMEGVVVAANPALAEAVAERLLSTLSARGVRFTVTGDRLRYDAPPGALDTQLVAAIRAHKTELLALLTDTPTAQNAADAAYLESIALVVEMLDATEAWAAVTDHPDLHVQEAACRRYQAKADQVKAFGRTLPEPERPAFHADLAGRMYRIRDTWLAQHL